MKKPDKKLFSKVQLTLFYKDNKPLTLDELHQAQVDLFEKEVIPKNLLVARTHYKPSDRAQLPTHAYNEMQSGSLVRTGKLGPDMKYALSPELFIWMIQTIKPKS